ncbi:MAG: nicotinamide-nucleotide amidohydrolase family protein [Parachlamydiales bacterium]
MQIELVAIGDELLRGTTINTNGAFLSRHLSEKGYRISRHTTLSDDPIVLKEGLLEVLKRSSIVITTGGLGATCDDRTREILARLFGSEFHFNESVAADLKKRFGEQLTSLEDQATIPAKAKPILNRVGTAPGLIFTEDQKTWIILPGVPQEMQEMFLNDALPYLLKMHPSGIQKKSVQLHFSLLYEGLVDPALRMLQEQYPQVDVGIYPGYGSLMVSLLSSQQQQLEQFQSGLEKKFGSYLFQSPNGKIEEAIHAWFVQNKKTLALAESCTGGLMAAHLTALSGASDYFLGSFVTYSNALKTKILDVPESTLQQTGAVSKETVAAMLEGVFKQSGADFGIAISGIAGPTGGSLQKPVGTMWAAIGERGKTPDIGTFIAKGNRQTRILSTTNNLLGALYRKVAKGIPAFPFFSSGL